jgi:hypothetical protein
LLLQGLGRRKKERKRNIKYLRPKKKNNNVGEEAGDRKEQKNRKIVMLRVLHVYMLFTSMC